MFASRCGHPRLYGVGLSQRGTATVLQPPRLAQYATYLPGSANGEENPIVMGKSFTKIPATSLASTYVLGAPGE